MHRKKEGRKERKEGASRTCTGKETHSQWPRGTRTFPFPPVMQFISDLCPGSKATLERAFYVLSSLLFLETQIRHCKIYLLLKSATESHMERMIIEAGSSRCIDWQRTAGRLISAVWIKTVPNLRTEKEGTRLPHTERQTQSRQKEGRETHTNLTLPELHSPDVRLVDLIQLHQFV